MCGFEITHASTLADQGFADPNATMEDYGWSMTDGLTSKSIRKAAQESPTADAIVVTGAGTGTLRILSDLESKVKRPIIAADTILYWAIAHELNLTLKPIMGLLADMRKVK
jgi:hypothetical protein